MREREREINPSQKETKYTTIVEQDMSKWYEVHVYYLLVQFLHAHQIQRLDAAGTIL